MNTEHSDLMSRVNESGDWNDDIEADYKAALDKFATSQAW